MLSRFHRFVNICVQITRRAVPSLVPLQSLLQKYCLFSTLLLDVILVGLYDDNERMPIPSHLKFHFAVIIFIHLLVS